MSDNQMVIHSGRRRSPRAMLRIPVIIKGADKYGFEFEEETETIVVSKFGARIFTVHEVEVGALFKLALKNNSGEWAEFRVAWVGSAENNTQGHIGLQFIHATNFFGVTFPEEEEWA